jgi:hypothetical protein
MNAAIGETAGAELTTANAPTTNRATKTASKALYNCHLDLLALTIGGQLHHLRCATGD